MKNVATRRIELFMPVFQLLLFLLTAFAGNCQPAAIEHHEKTEAFTGTHKILTLEEACLLARENYPLTIQRGLLKKAMSYSVDNAAKGYLPQPGLSGQASIQSDVTTLPFKVPITGFTMPQYSRDQYRIYAEVDQLLYDGGMIRNQQQAAEVNELIQEAKLDVELYGLYDRVNQLFFGILLLDEQLKQNTLLKKDIQNGIDKVEALARNGMAYKSSVDELKAQLLQADQSRVEEITTRRAYLEMLGAFLGHQPDESTLLEIPAPPVITDSISRPELALYEYQKKVSDLQDQLSAIRLRPRIGLFLQGGYGRPGLNMLSNDFQLYYIGGIRLSWNPGSLYTHKNQKQISILNRKTLDAGKETFLFNTRLSRRLENAEIARFRELIRSDDDIIALRTAVKNAAGAQLENGVLSAHDYLTQVIAEDRARQNRFLHQLLLLQAQYKYSDLTGHP